MFRQNHYLGSRAATPALWAAGPPGRSEGLRTPSETQSRFRFPRGSAPPGAAGLISIGKGRGTAPIRVAAEGLELGARALPILFRELTFPGARG